MNKKTSLLIGIFLLIIAVCFISYAVNHPEATFPWNNRVTFMFYGIYIWLIFKFLLAIPVLKAIKETPSTGNILRAVVFFFMAIVFFIMELAGKTVDIYTILRGFIVIGGIDIGTENIYLWIKTRNKNTEK